MKYAGNVRIALSEKTPIVAVESTLLTHGLSYPNSFHMVLEIEQMIRNQGAESAVIAVLDGTVCIGLEREEMERLTKMEKVHKLTTADLGMAVTQSLSGGTTAASTAWIAHKAGIRVVLAGGLGGVHRDVLDTWDISNDLTILSQTPILMVCGGIKNFLDIGKSLEVLETLGVPVWSFGSDRFPGYFVRESPCLAVKVESEEEAARMASTHWELGLQTGILFGVPIPQSFAFEKDEIEFVIKKVLEETKGTGGKSVTPAIIRAIEQHTKGRSAESNKALLLNAARTAARTAMALSML